MMSVLSLVWQPESEFVDDDPDVVFERCLLDGDLGDTMELSAQHVRYYLPSVNLSHCQLSQID